MAMDDRQYSDLTFKDFESKKSDAEDVATFTGVASTSDIDLHGDIIEPNAFGKIAKNLPMLRNHDMDQHIGGWREFEQDGKLLKVEGAVTLLTERGRETHALMKQGFLTGISVGFRPKAGGVQYDDQTGVRRIKKATLLEASVVSIPANQAARVRSVKSEGVLKSREALTDWLRGCGFTVAECDTVITKGFASLLDAARLPFTGIDGHFPLDDAAVEKELRGLLTQMTERVSHV